MNQVRPPTRRFRVNRVNEVQGMLAMQELLAGQASSDATRPEASSPRPHEPRPRRTPADVSPLPLPYRKVLAGWPDDWRERWGRRANDLEDAGISWRDAEGRAFVETCADFKAAHGAGRN